jgi:hypothetical protein
VDLWVCGPSTSDLSIFGGYMSDTGLAGILLDGSRGGGRVATVSIDGLRIEGERAQHCLVARGNVDALRLRNGQWVSGSGEPIYFEPGGAGRYWDISGLSLVIYDGLNDGPGAEPVTYAPGPDHYRMARFASPLRDSTLSILDNYPTHFQKNAQGTLVPSYPHGQAVVFAAAAAGNTITVRRRDEVDFQGEDQGNVIEALEDNGIMRTYEGSGGLPALLNLPPCDVSRIPNPKLGDLAVDNGTNIPDHQPGPMFYDGKKWRALSLAP